MCPDQDDPLEDPINVYCPPTLLKLTRESLLSEEDLTIYSLEDLPDELFPMMFEEAFIKGQTKILTTMITMWPFSYLSVGTLIKNLCLFLKAVLEGLDILISKPVHSSRCKLREINWRDRVPDFYGICAGSHEGECLPEFTGQKLALENSPDCGMKKELWVTTQLKLVDGSLDECATFLLQWAQQRKDSIRLCCKKLKIQGLSKATILDTFKIVHADCIQDLELCCLCLEDLDFLNPYLRQMNNLLSFSLDKIKDTTSMGYTRKDDEENAITVISPFPTLHHLRELYVNDVPFLKGYLKECLRCLKKPLQPLWITRCYLPQFDLDYLLYCLNIFELKCLHLANIPFCHLLLEPLGCLLERVRNTLECLHLKLCGMGEPQSNALLPALKQCSHLTEVNFYGNELSLILWKKVLHHTAKLSQLTDELYPAPLDCYENRNVIRSDRLEKFCPELLDILRAKRNPKRVTFATYRCFRCGGYYVYNLNTQCSFFEKNPLSC